jgi:GNAT superfamily N-acetyltransferase
MIEEILYLVIFIFIINIFFYKKQNNFTSKNFNNKYSNKESNNKESNNKDLNKFFEKNDLKLFRKYEKYSKIIKIPQGQVTICPSKLIEEIPQITWNGYFINNLVVYPEFRKKGYGKILLKKIINKAKKEEQLHLISQVNEKNIPAMNLHYEMGFKSYFRGLDKNNNIVRILVYYF